MNISKAVTLICPYLPDVRLCQADKCMAWEYDSVRGPADTSGPLVRYPSCKSKLSGVCTKKEKPSSFNTMESYFQEHLTGVLSEN
jgi:hypothetical protein